FGLLVSALLSRSPQEPARRVSFSRGAARALVRHRWPFNIRELERALASAMALAGHEGYIDLAHLPKQMGGTSGCDGSAARSDPNGQSPDRVTGAQLDELLRSHAGNVSQVARDLGMTRYQLRRVMQMNGIDPKYLSEQARWQRRAAVSEGLRLHHGNLSQVAR